MIDSMLAEGQKQIDRMPDSVDRRIMQRKLRKIDGKLYESKTLIEKLEKRNEQDLPLIRDFREIFIKELQSVLDFLSDVYAKPGHGIADLSIFSLFVLCIDELLAAFHLGQHYFISQACSHLRTISETLDKIELFNQHPEWLDLWVSKDPANQRKQRNEFSPSEVRKKLGKESYDPLYSSLSELGAHTSFKNIQTRIALKKASKNEKQVIGFWIGGCPFEHNVVYVFNYLLYFIQLITLKLVQVYEEELNIEEVEMFLVTMVGDLKVFSETYLIEWVEREGFDSESIHETLEIIEKNILKDG